MKHPDGTPFTPAERTAERFRRWAWLAEQQRSATPISEDALPLFKRYANLELGSLAELIEQMHRHFNRRRFPKGPDGPEVPELPAPPRTEEPTVCEGVMVMDPEPSRQSREAREEALNRWTERRKQENPDDPWIGRWVTVTASCPKKDERELN